MIEQFIPYEQALALKELRFNENCIGFYDSKYQLRLVSQKSHNTYSRIMRNISLRNAAKCTAPLWQQAFDWFREKYGISSFIHIDGSFNFSINFGFGISTFKGNYNYEESRLKCLEKLIEIVETKNKES